MHEGEEGLREYERGGEGDVRDGPVGEVWRRCEGGGGCEATRGT